MRRLERRVIRQSAAPARHRAAPGADRGAAAVPPGRGSAARARRAALRARRGRDAPRGRLGDAHPAGRALAGEARPLLLAGGVGVPTRWARRRPPRGCPRCWPRCSWRAPRRSSARGSTARAAGLHARLRSLGTVRARVRVRPRRQHGHAAGRLRHRGDRRSSGCACSASRGAWRCRPPASSCGLAMLAKGPLGLLLPALAVLRLRCWPTRDLAAAPAPALARRACCSSCSWPRPGTSSSTAPRARPFVDVFLLDHNVRALHVARSTATRARPCYYVPVLLAGLFPWSGLLVPGARAGCGRGATAPTSSSCAWLALPLLFFSAAGSKLPGYILPCLPPLALADGPRGRTRWPRRRRGARRARPARVALVTLALARCVAAVPARAARGRASRCGGCSSRWRPGRCSWRSSFSRRLGRDAGGRAAAPAGRRGRAPAAAGAGARRRSWRARESGRDALPARRRAARCWPGAPGARRGWPATSTTTPACARSSGLDEIARGGLGRTGAGAVRPGERRMLQRAPRLSARAAGHGPAAATCCWRSAVRRAAGYVGLLHHAARPCRPAAGNA